MKTYTLTATLKGIVNTVPFTSDSDEHAIVDAAFKVLSVAPSSRLWATGLIELRDPDGVVISTMPAKV